jgi:hypothetical protein
MLAGKIGRCARIAESAWELAPRFCQRYGRLAIALGAQICSEANFNYERKKTGVSKNTDAGGTNRN